MNVVINKIKLIQFNDEVFVLEGNNEVEVTNLDDEMY